MLLRAPSPNCTINDLKSTLGLSVHLARLESIVELLALRNLATTLLKCSRTRGCVRLGNNKKAQTYLETLLESLVVHGTCILLGLLNVLLLLGLLLLLLLLGLFIAGSRESTDGGSNSLVCDSTTSAKGHAGSHSAHEAAHHTA
jgi:hypothetical protein